MEANDDDILLTVFVLVITIAWLHSWSEELIICWTVFYFVDIKNINQFSVCFHVISSGVDIILQQISRHLNDSKVGNASCVAHMNNNIEKLKKKREKKVCLIKMLKKNNDKYNRKVIWINCGKKRFKYSYNSKLDWICVQIEKQAVYSEFNLSCRTPRKLNFKILNF